MVLQNLRHRHAADSAALKYQSSDSGSTIASGRIYAVA
jgi:hypothetical protein